MKSAKKPSPVPKKNAAADQTFETIDQREIVAGLTRTFDKILARNLAERKRLTALTEAPTFRPGTAGGKAVLAELGAAELRLLTAAAALGLTPAAEQLVDALELLGLQVAANND